MIEKSLLAMGIGCLLFGCDYTVPLDETPKEPMDPILVGRWSRTDENGKNENLLVLPLGPKEYLVSYPAEDPKAMFARACLCRAGTLALVQLTWFGTAQGVVPRDKRVYQYVAYSVNDGTLCVSLLNADVVKRDTPTSDALRQAIAANRDHADLFREALLFKKEPTPDTSPSQLTRPPIPPAWQ